jgi:hypothetical protein
MVRAVRMFSVATLAALFALIVVPERAFTGEKSVAGENDTGVPEKWAREDGQRAAGGGSIVPAGAGGFGDVPPDPQDADRASPACDAPEEEPDELGEVWCGPQSRGAQCAALCVAEQGVICPDGILHSVTKDAAWLYKCCGCKGKQQCWYVTNDGRKCTYQPELRSAFRIKCDL